MKLQGELITEDNEKICYEYYKGGHNHLIIIAHGFFNSKDAPLFKKIAEDFNSYYDILLFDFRGHGTSTGLFTWTADESNDLNAVIGHAKGQHYKSIGLIGFSLGAAVSLIAVSKCDDIKSAVLISCPARINEIDFKFWEPAMFSDLRSNFESKWQGKGARVTIPFYKREEPIECVQHIEKTPLFFIHGDKDWVVKPRHSQQLYRKAKSAKKIEIIKDGMHAERLFEQDPKNMEILIRNWFSETL